jgi:hypothetical protein
MLANVFHQRPPPPSRTSVAPTSTIAAGPKLDRADVGDRFVDLLASPLLEFFALLLPNDAFVRLQRNP